MRERSERTISIAIGGASQLEGAGPSVGAVGHRRQPVSARRISIKERRELKQLSKKPRTRAVPHPFLLPDVRHEQK